MGNRVRNNRKVFAGFVAVSVVALAFLAITTAVRSDGPSSSGPATPNGPVQFEEIPGSPIKRVILTEKAVERLGIETGKIEMAQVGRKQVLGGRIIPPVKNPPKTGGTSFGFANIGKFAWSTPPKEGGADAPSSGPSEVWVEVVLSYGEFERLQKEKPVRILPLFTRDGHEVVAEPSGLPLYEDQKRSMLTIHYKVSGLNHGLSLYDRVRVEMPLMAGSDKPQQVAPYSAVYYDGQGAAWVYTNPKPFVYERQAIVIEYIEGYQAVLVSGPSAGTAVVVTGAPLLYGAEVIYKK